MKPKTERSHAKEIRSDVYWALFIAFGWLLLLSPGSIDGVMHPVVEPLKIEKTEPFDDAWTQFSGSSVKLRQCSFREVQWYLGTRDKPNVPVPVVMGEPQIRMVGSLKIEDWRAKIAPVERLKTETFADVYHQCSWAGVDFPWLTKTRFWN